MKKTVFITGASSGIGKETAIKFAKMGWNVVAAMRSPEKENTLKKYENVFLAKLDVTEPTTIDHAVKEAVNRYKTIDVLVNNAGYYSIGVLEAISEEEIVRQLDTNLIGLIRVTKAVLPIMREKQCGMIINVSSVAGRTTVPLQTIYHASKWGVEGFTESLQFEVKQFGIDVVLVEPGVIKTDFYNRSMSFASNDNLLDYQSISKNVSEYLVSGGNNGSSPVEIGKKFMILLSQKRESYAIRWGNLRVYSFYTESFREIYM